MVIYVCSWSVYIPWLFYGVFLYWILDIGVTGGATGWGKLVSCWGYDMFNSCLLKYGLLGT